MIRINNLVYLVVRKRARYRMQIEINLKHMREEGVLKTSCSKQRSAYERNGNNVLCCVRVGVYIKH